MNSSKTRRTWEQIGAIPFCTWRPSLRVDFNWRIRLRFTFGAQWREGKWTERSSTRRRDFELVKSNSGRFPGAWKFRRGLRIGFLRDSRVVPRCTAFSTCVSFRSALCKTQLHKRNRRWSVQFALIETSVLPAGSAGETPRFVKLQPPLRNAHFGRIVRVFPPCN